MRRFYLWGVALLVVAGISLGADARKLHAEENDKWASAMQAFDRQDEAEPFPAGGIVFVGSSSIRLWDLAKSFPNRQLLNRGFGGSQTADAVKYVERLVLKHRPNKVIFYEGDNDLAAGKSPKTVADDYALFADKVRAELPECSLLILSIKPCSSRWHLKQKQDETNQLLQKVAADREGIDYLDVGSLLLKEDGKPNDDLFLADRLHLNEKGYRLWSEAVERWLAKDHEEKR